MLCLEIKSWFMGWKEIFKNSQNIAHALSPTFFPSSEEIAAGVDPVVLLESYAQMLASAQQGFNR